MFKNLSISYLHNTCLLPFEYQLQEITVEDLSQFCVTWEVIHPEHF
jgi:hypothetical protein